MSNIILAIECSMNYCSVAIYKKKIYSFLTKCEKKHTVKILPIIYKILKISNTKLQEINYIAFSQGPGNFTGIRIATGISQGLSCALNIPILGISTFSILAEQAWRKYKAKKVLVVMNAQINKFYYAKYIKNSKSLWIGEKTESLLRENQISNKINNLHKNWTLVGNSWNHIPYKKKIFDQKDIFFPHAKDIIPLALLNINLKKFMNYNQFNIKYLDNLFTKK
ncbi:tRNA (adenosine(37)-N6)-threonylcarbamoyltransferase complex dimerization subunit type 1 TsaB [Buchnera aphidicola (Melanaphis sacchari)]|uniref:tRNA threonylcarbamoyladenosine biosynthesis protein TsaB n=1 Tax=Buchnera aphidicola (Melanaphis sacchari) TaxID=2173854 RepID=A0A2U8DFJ5_9GAMM|nr:tRNA (adenosine(37)-N6)-threonylcarbamoyltransferase complex dimerization subunit type 1 TsaB [Buchnera aphidicola]AWH90467.1 tRNA (adenosine(37)-N6)-threonylcarbamoyltransferase complex dimerization subunit type 1 TsaB [Buchnera aphidicola (Melanaphis sacchari)]